MTVSLSAWETIESRATFALKQSSEMHRAHLRKDWGEQAGHTSDSGRVVNIATQTRFSCGMIRR